MNYFCSFLEIVPLFLSDAHYSMSYVNIASYLVQGVPALCGFRDLKKFKLHKIRVSGTALKTEVM